MTRQGVTIDEGEDLGVVVARLVCVGERQVLESGCLDLKGLRRHG